MPADLDRLYEHLGTFAENTGRVDPALLRTAGSRRRRTRTALTLAAVVLVVLAGLGAGAVLRARSQPPLPATTTPPTGAPTPTATAPPSTAPPSTVPATAPRCTAADLASPPRQGHGLASGSAYLHIIVTNTSGHDCTLHGAATIWGKRGGQLVKIPQSVVITGQPDTATLLAGDVAWLSVETVNGYGGYPTNAPACAHPTSYQDLELDLGAGIRYHTGAALTVTCGSPAVFPWEAAAPVCSTANFAPPEVASTLPHVDGYQITLTNSGADCSLDPIVTLRYTDSGRPGSLSGGQQTGLPTDLPAGAQTKVFVLAPGDKSPCASPVSLQDLELVSGSLHLPLPGTLELPCATPTLVGWG